METIITALGPDSRNLADPIIHDATARGARIAEIQMYDHDERQQFAMLCRIDLDGRHVDDLRASMREVGERTGLAVRVWSPPRGSRPRLAICGTYIPETPGAVLDAIAGGRINADPVVMIANRQKLRPLAESHDIPFHNIGDADGVADDAAMVELIDRYDVDYVILARYMRVLPASTCWQFAGGRIINLHHGLLPGFPGFRPYHDAHAARMLSYGATCHFIIPELDAGNQTINQQAFSVDPGTPLEEIIDRGRRMNEPQTLVEGVRRVVDGEVTLHFHRVVPRQV